MYIEIQKTKKSEFIFLRKSQRDKETGKIKKVTIANLTHEPVEQVMGIINTLRGKLCVNPEDLTQGKTIGFSLVIHFIMKLLGIIKANR